MLKVKRRRNESLSFSSFNHLLLFRMNFDGLPRQARDKYISGKLSKRALCCSAPGGADRDPAPGLATQGWLEPGKKTVLLDRLGTKIGKPHPKKTCLCRWSPRLCFQIRSLPSRVCAWASLALWRYLLRTTQLYYIDYAFKIFESSNF